MSELQKYPRTGKGKGKQVTNTQRGSRGITTLSLTLALDGVGVQRHAPAALPPRKRPGTLCYRSLVGPQSRSERVRKISPPTGFDPRTVQPVASLYTDYALPALQKYPRIK